MAAECPFTVRYRFERLAGASESEFERAAQVAYQLVQTVPWAVPRLPFGTASRVSGGLLETVPVTPGFPHGSLAPQERLRLRAIESSEGALLENSYNTDGRLVETVYPDGLTVRYRWDDAGQLTTVYLPGGDKISYEYGEDRLLHSVMYPGGSQFRYHYYADGRLLGRVYPDNACVSYRYDGQGRSLEASLGNSRFVYEWDGQRALKRVLFLCSNEIHELGLSRDRLEVNLTPNRAEGAPASEFVSALGLWTYSSDGRLRQMVLPDGERLCFRPGAVAGGDALWTSWGQTAYHYDKAGVLSEVVHPNGVRAVWRRHASSGLVSRVSPEGVALYQYGERGGLLKVRSAEGQYAILAYDRRGAVKRVATASGWMQLRRDATARLAGIEFSSGLSAALSYGTEGWLARISLRKAAPDTLAAALAFAQAAWEWMAPRSSLRLADPGIQEE